MRQLKNILKSIDGKGVQQLSLICGKDYLKCGINYSFSHLEGELVLIEIKIPLEQLCSVTISDIESYLTLSYSDFLYRTLYSYIKELDGRLINKNKGDSYTGRIISSPPSDVIVSNNYSYIDSNTNNWVVRIKAILPNSNKKINSEKATKLLIQFLPNQIQKFLTHIHDKDYVTIMDHVLDLAREQNFIRQYICIHGYVGFIGNGSKLCDEKNVKESRELILFKSPKEHEVEIKCNNKIIRGMGIPKGFTCITGGSYSGKTTFLNALALGVYNYPFGSGKEYIISINDTVTICMEEKRVINSTDMRLFYKSMPGNELLLNYSDNCASACVSQAANTVEALTWGARLILIDEDRSAANFLWRDDTISTLIGTDVFTPFNTILPSIIKKFDVSCVLVTGSNSSFLKTADNAFIFDNFRIHSLMINYYDKNTNSNIKDIVIPNLNDEKWIFDESGRLLFDYKTIEKYLLGDTNEIKVGDSIISIGCWDTVLTQNQVNTLLEFVKWISHLNYSTPLTFNSLVNQFVYEHTFNISFQSNKERCFKESPYVYDFFRLLNRLKVIKKYVKISTE